MLDKSKIMARLEYWAIKIGEEIEKKLSETEKQLKTCEKILEKVKEREK